MFPQKIIQRGISSMQAFNLSLDSLGAAKIYGLSFAVITLGTYMAFIGSANQLQVRSGPLFGGVDGDTQAG